MVKNARNELHDLLWLTCKFLTLSQNARKLFHRSLFAYVHNSCFASNARKQNMLIKWTTCNSLQNKKTHVTKKNIQVYPTCKLRFPGNMHVKDKKTSSNYMQIFILNQIARNYTLNSHSLGSGTSNFIVSCVNGWVNSSEQACRHKRLNGSVCARCSLSPASGYPYAARWARIWFFLPVSRESSNKAYLLPCFIIL